MLNFLYFYISTFGSMCAVSNMDVFCSYLISCSPVMLLRYCLRFWDGSSCPCCYWYRFYFHNPHALYFYV